MENYFDIAFKYLEDTKYSNNEIIKQKLQGFKQEVAEGFMSSGSNFERASEDNAELLECINDCAINLISLMKLYKYMLKNEGKQDLGSYSYEQDQLLFINDTLMSAFMSMLPKGSELSMNFCNDDEDVEEDEG